MYTLELQTDDDASWALINYLIRLAKIQKNPYEYPKARHKDSPDLKELTVIAWWYVLVRVATSKPSVENGLRRRTTTIIVC